MDVARVSGTDTGNDRPHSIRKENQVSCSPLHQTGPLYLRPKLLDSNSPAQEPSFLMAPRNSTERGQSWQEATQHSTAVQETCPGPASTSRTGNQIWEQAMREGLIFSQYTQPGRHIYVESTHSPALRLRAERSREEQSGL